MDSVDVTNIFEFIFNSLYHIFDFMNSVRFSAFGFEFSLIGIVLSFLVLITLVSVLKFGIVNESASEISFQRSENRVRVKNNINRTAKIRESSLNNFHNNLASEQLDPNFKSRWL